MNPVVGGADEGVYDTYPPRVAALTTPPTPPGDHVMIEVPVPESAVGVPGCVIDVGLADGRHINVPIPEGTAPGEVLRVTVPPP